MKTGDAYRYTFDTAGTFEYLCTIHPFMTASVVVTP
jgi:plastocyanin